MWFWGHIDSVRHGLAIVLKCGVRRLPPGDVWSVPAGRRAFPTAAGACFSPSPPLWYPPTGRRGTDTFPVVPRAWLRFRLRRIYDNTDCTAAPRRIILNRWPSL